ncbi:hypothetical protein DDZ13_06430 [Coraliomargarita sinensis]|uniref:Uncharacterized protein n=2 Tax=Coraliomargarita sinensis TaxID=2174842 RepID=A0A317ZLI2_9BACT|nr:hypothetical protein DDZ13_06430 [Coraliomargarita sinensis]
MKWLPPSASSASIRILLPLLLLLTGCEEKVAYNDNYERHEGDDMILRELLGVHTLRNSFQKPEGMKSFCVGVILIEKEEVVGISVWQPGNGLHTVHSGGLKEYAKTIHAEYVIRKKDDDWQSVFRVNPSFTSQQAEVNNNFWDIFSSDKLRTRGTNMNMASQIGDLTVIAAIYGAEEYVSVAPLDQLLRDMDYLALLAVRFYPEDITSEMPPRLTKEELQKIIYGD